MRAIRYRAHLLLFKDRAETGIRPAPDRAQKSKAAERKHGIDCSAAAGAAHIAEICREKQLRRCKSHAGSHERDCI